MLRLSLLCVCIYIDLESFLLWFISFQNNGELTSKTVRRIFLLRKHLSSAANSYMPLTVSLVHHRPSFPSPLKLFSHGLLHVYLKVKLPLKNNSLQSPVDLKCHITMETAHYNVFSMLLFRGHAKIGKCDLNMTGYELNY